MEIEKRPPQNVNVRSRETNKWPFAGASAADLLKTNYHVMVAADLFVTSGFQMFYQEWILNMPSGKEKQLFVPYMEIKDTSVSSIYRGMQILQYNGCSDYVSLFRNIKGLGTWLFLAGSERKMEYIIKAAKEAGTYIRVYGLDYDGRLKNYRVPMKGQHNLKNSLPSEDIFSLPKEMPPIRKVVRKTQSVPGKGGIVYTSSHQQVRLREEFISNPQIGRAHV